MKCEGEFVALQRCDSGWGLSLHALLTFNWSAASKFKYGDEHKRKPSCPRRDDMPIHGLTTSKNFVTSNAIENILSGASHISKLCIL